MSPLTRTTRTARNPRPALSSGWPGAGLSLACRLGAALAVLAMAGCATSSGGGADTGLLDRALQAVGITKPPLPEVQVSDLPTLSRKIALRLHAGDILNTDAKGGALSLVTRIYKLKDSAAFTQATYDRATSGHAPKDAAFVQDIVEMREVVLNPGTHSESVETMPPQAKYLAVVALFREPADARWRFVFETKSAAESGITLGLHACAMSVAQGQPLNATLESQRLAGVICGKKQVSAEAK